MLRLLQFEFSSPPPPLPIQIPPPPPSPSSHSTNLNLSFLIIGAIVVGVFFISAFLHLLLRYLNTRTTTNASITVSDDVSSIDQQHSHRISSRRVVPDDHKALIDSLPLFSFNSLTHLRSHPDCAVCLSKFQPHDQLRLLPVCCHAFHSICIDTWLGTNHTCPLCRSTIHVEQSEGYLKLFSSSADQSNRTSSFRVEIGSVQRIPSADSGRFRSYSIGSFEYFVEDESEIEVANVEPTERRDSIGGKKDEVSTSAPEPPGSELAGEVSSGRGRLKDYVERLVTSSSSSLSSRFRNSGRFFTASGRRSDGGAAGNGGSWDLEGNEYGQEISSFFRWLSGV